MLYTPTHQFQLIPDSEYLEKIPKVEKELSSYAEQGTIKSFDGCKLAYELYPVEHSSATIIIIHGLSEFYKKYYEITWYFMNMGYNVLLFDLRGHGYSDRKVEKLSLVHVDSFDDYIEDLHCMIKQVAKAKWPDTPIYLYAHSMGGAIAGLYLAKYPSIARCAILSSPMLCPVTAKVPSWFAAMHIHHLLKTEGDTAPFKYGRDFDPNVEVTASNDLSYGRFRYNLDYRINNEIYQTSIATNRWMWESMQVQKRMLSRATTSGIKDDILLLSAGKDRTVKIPPQKRFAKKIPTCTLVTFPESKHTIYTGTDEILKEYYKTIFDYLKKQDAKHKNS